MPGHTCPSARIFWRSDPDKYILHGTFAKKMKEEKQRLTLTVSFFSQLIIFVDKYPKLVNIQGNPEWMIHKNVVIFLFVLTFLRIFHGNTFPSCIDVLCYDCPKLQSHNYIL